MSSKKKRPQMPKRDSSRTSRQVNVNAPVAQSFRVPAPRFDISRSGSFGIRIRGADRLFVVDHPNASITVGDLITSFPLSPNMAGLSRLSREAALYQKFRFNSVRIIFIPSCPTTTAVSIAVAFVRDPHFVPIESGGDDALQQLYASPGFGSGVAWTMFVATYLKDKATNWCFVTPPPTSSTSDELFQLSPAQVVILWATSDSNNSGSTMGTFFIEYDVDLEEPCLDNVPSASSAYIAWDADPNADHIYNGSGPQEFAGNMPVSYVTPETETPLAVTFTVPTNQLIQVEHALDGDLTDTKNEFDWEANGSTINGGIEVTIDEGTVISTGPSGQLNTASIELGSAVVNWILDTTDTVTTTLQSYVNMTADWVLDELKTDNVRAVFKFFGVSSSDPIFDAYRCKNRVVHFHRKRELFRIDPKEWDVIDGLSTLLRTPCPKLLRRKRLLRIACLVRLHRLSRNEEKKNNSSVPVREVRRVEEISPSYFDAKVSTPVATIAILTKPTLKLGVEEVRKR